MWPKCGKFVSKARQGRWRDVPNRLIRIEKSRSMPISSPARRPVRAVATDFPFSADCDGFADNVGRGARRCGDQPRGSAAPSFGASPSSGAAIAGARPAG
ncbi:hypothetical protein, partial [Albidovulum sp.]|uniref:hypothetical protein n=1 Tax=Albidovulum sp. TaxID=1872424 RepID=UPI0039B87BA5